MILASDIRRGTKILHNNQPYVVIDFQHVKPGKGGAFMRTKMKSLVTGLVHEETYRSEEKLQAPDLDYREMTYLYNDGDMYYFMDQASYEEITLSKDQLDDVIDLLKEQIVYNVVYFSGKALSVNAPLHMELVVTQTPPGVRGDTAQGSANKTATLETGLVLQVPLFVNEGDTIKIDTRDRSYVERIIKK